MAEQPDREYIHVHAQKQSVQGDSGQLFRAGCPSSALCILVPSCSVMALGTCT